MQELLSLQELSVFNQVIPGISVTSCDALSCATVPEREM